MNSKDPISNFFEPQSIAIFGSFREGTFGGYMMIRNLLDSGYQGKIFPVNPTLKEQVLNYQVFPSVLAITEEIDLAAIMIGAASVPEVLRQCAGQGIKSVVLVADGFAERDEKGVELQQEIVAIAKESGMRLIGPNTAGIANIIKGFNPCPYYAGYSDFCKGGVSICSQTGMINPQAYPYWDLKYKISKICDLGNKCDVDECDMLEYLANDPDTRVISIYMESIANGRRFAEIVGRVTAKKPVLILKTGRTSEGAKASASHTGSLAVDDDIFEATCRQTGILRLDKFNELFEIPRIFASQPLPKDNRLGIFSFTGGVGVLATDEGSRHGITVGPLTTKTTFELNKIFPGLGKNPVDLGPSVAAVGDMMASYGKILMAIAADENVDMILIIPWVSPNDTFSDIYLQAYQQLKESCKKPVATWIYGPLINYNRDLIQKLEEIGFPVFNELETAVKALGMMVAYANTKKQI